MTITVKFFHKVTGWVPYDVYGPTKEREARKDAARLATAFYGVEIHFQPEGGTLEIEVVSS